MFRRLIFAALLCSPLFVAAQGAKTGNALEQLQKLNQVYRYLNGAYVDSVDMAPLVEKAVESMLSELDPHSAYINSDDMRGVKESFDGEFSGIGLYGTQGRGIGTGEFHFQNAQARGSVDRRRRVRQNRPRAASRHRGPRTL